MKAFIYKNLCVKGFFSETSILGANSPSLKRPKTHTFEIFLPTLVKYKVPYYAVTVICNLHQDQVTWIYIWIHQLTQFLFAM